MISRRPLLAAGVLAATGISNLAVAQPAARKPRLPPGRDPGGVAVALIGAGVDYAKSTLAPRLARDGEGELIGWDAIDKDIRPLERSPAGAIPSVPEAGTQMAELLLAGARDSRLVPVRSADQSLSAIAEALSFVARTPARIVVLLASPAPGDQPDPLRRLVSSLPQLLVVVPVTKPSLGGPSNMVVAASADREGHALAGEMDDGAGIDIAIGIDPPTLLPGRPGQRYTRHLAAVALGALSARLLAKERPADAIALKSRLLALATPPHAAASIKTRAGLIAHPEQQGQP